MNKKKYKGFIFDLDGTLLDSRYDIVKATNATIVAMGGKPLDEDLIASFVGIGVRPLMQAALKKVRNLDPKTVFRFFSDYYIEHCADHSDFYDGVEDFLKHLQNQNKAAAILTNKPQRFTDIVLKKLDKEKFFQKILGADAGFPNKPKPDGLLHVLESLNLTKNDVLYLGDTKVDYDTAQNVGCDVALFTAGFTDKEKILEFFKTDAGFLFDGFQTLYDYV